MKTAALIVVIIFLLGCSASISVKKLLNMDGNITSYGIQPGNNFFVEVEKEPRLNLQWEAGTHGSYTNTSFVANDSLIYIPDLSGRITAFNILDGKENGELKYDGSIEQTIIVEKNRLIFIVNQYKEKYSNFIVYDFLKGNELANTVLDGKFSNELVKIDNSILCASEFGKIYSVSTFGIIEWVQDLESEIYSIPASDGKSLYVATYNGKIFKISPTDGKILDVFEFDSEFESGIAMDKNSLYIGDNFGELYSINKDTGQINWKIETNYKINTSPSFDESSLYVGNLGGEIYSVSKNDGEILWSYNSGGLINTSPLVLKNLILQSNLNNKLEILDKNKGSLLGKIEFNSRVRTVPIYYRDRIILGIDKGEVRCYVFTESKES